MPRTRLSWEQLFRGECRKYQCLGLLHIRGTPDSESRYVEMAVKKGRLMKPDGTGPINDPRYRVFEDTPSTRHTTRISTEKAQGSGIRRSKRLARVPKPSVEYRVFSPRLIPLSDGSVRDRNGIGPFPPRVKCWRLKDI